MLYTSKPKGFVAQFRVVACFLLVGQEFLLLKRHRQASQPGTWGLPAGKVEKRETLQEAMQRELKEETGFGAKLQMLEFMEEAFVSHEDNSFVYYTFKLKQDIKPSVELNPREHETFAWKTAKDNLALPLIPDLDTCVKRLL